MQIVTRLRGKWMEKDYGIAGDCLGAAALAALFVIALHIPAIV